MNSIVSLLLCTVGIILGLLSPSSLAFSPNINIHKTFAKNSPTSLNSIVFEPPPEDNCELDGSNCEESVFEQKRREKAEAREALNERARLQGIQLSEVDFQSSVDQYQNAPTGGSLIPGMTLTSMCEDD